MFLKPYLISKSNLKVFLQHFKIFHFIFIFISPNNISPQKIIVCELLFNLLYYPMAYPIVQLGVVHLS